MGGRWYTPTSGGIDAWKQAIAMTFAASSPPGRVRPAEEELWRGAVRVDLAFYFERPPELCTSEIPDEPVPYLAKPDRDNLEKAVLDVLSKRLYTDDRLAYLGRVGKWYASSQGGPGLIVEAELHDSHAIRIAAAMGGQTQTRRKAATRRLRGEA